MYLHSKLTYDPDGRVDLHVRLVPHLDDRDAIVRHGIDRTAIMIAPDGEPVSVADLMTPAGLVFHRLHTEQFRSFLDELRCALRAIADEIAICEARHRSRLAA